MRFLKLTLISFIILFSVVTIIGLLFPSTVSVSRATEIATSYDTVYKYLNDVKYWKLWMASADTSTIVFESVRTAGTGTVAKIGTGEVTMTRTTRDSIYTTWKSEKGNVQNSAFVIMHNLRDSNLTVQWYFEQKLNWYPWERFGSLANDKFLGPVMEESLHKLKTVLEVKK
jgi:Polyketide cyclase / dehydrase and lipid transport